MYLLLSPSFVLCFFLKNDYYSNLPFTPIFYFFSFLSGFGGSGSQVDSARMNLASSFVNGFVNAAFGQDKLLTEDGNKWLYKNKDHGKGHTATRLHTYHVECQDG